MANPWDFLSKWSTDHTQPVAILNPPDALVSQLAEQCLRAARAEGFKEDTIIRAANGNLQGFLRSELESAANAEVQRQVNRDRH
jgi:hypothetical protein